jgi:hypothetical protein
MTAAYIKTYEAHIKTAKMHVNLPRAERHIDAQEFLITKLKECKSHLILIPHKKL